MNSDNFVNLPPARLFFRCAVPAVITSVFGALYSVVDGIFIGRFLGGDALAAVNIIMPVIMIVEAVSNMIATGLSVNISMLLGRRRREDAPGAGDNVINLSVQYLQVYACFGPLIPVHFAMDNYLRVVSREKLSMVIGIASQGLNVIMDFVLIVVLHKGVQAAAISIVMYVDGIIRMLNFGLCDSLQPAISYCHGARERKRLRKIFRIVVAAFIAVSAAVSAAASGMLTLTIARTLN